MGVVHVVRNRAIHGDLVVVELLPQSQWKSKIGSLPTNHDKITTTANITQKSTQVTPTGRVVGVLERVKREIVASFEVSCDLSYYRYMKPYFYVPKMFIKFIGNACSGGGVHVYVT